MTPYSDKFWSPLVWVMTCYQFSANPLHVGLGQLNYTIGIAAQFKFQNWKWNWNWWIENGIGNTCIGIGIENYVNGIEILQLLLHQIIVNQPVNHTQKWRGGHYLSCDRPLMQQVCLTSKTWGLAPCGVVTKVIDKMPLSPWVNRGIKDGNNEYQLNSLRPSDTYMRQ